MLASQWLDPLALLLTRNGSKIELNPSLGQKRQRSTLVVMQHAANTRVQKSTSKTLVCTTYSSLTFYPIERQKPTFLLNGFNLRGGHHIDMPKVKPFYKLEFYNHTYSPKLPKRGVKKITMIVVFT